MDMVKDKGDGWGSARAGWGPDEKTARTANLPLRLGRQAGPTRIRYDILCAPSPFLGSDGYIEYPFGLYKSCPGEVA